MTHMYIHIYIYYHIWKSRFKIEQNQKSKRILDGGTKRPSQGLVSKKSFIGLSNVYVKFIVKKISALLYFLEKISEHIFVFSRENIKAHYTCDSPYVISRWHGDNTSMCVRVCVCVCACVKFIVVSTIYKRTTLLTLQMSSRDDTMTIHPCVCVCVCACVKFIVYNTSISTQDELSVFKQLGM